MFRGLLRPGQGFLPFTVMRRTGGTAASGRPKTKGLSPVGEIAGMISRASQNEIEQSKQSGHPITHTIVQRGTKNRAKVTDVLELKTASGECRRFLVQAVHDPANLGHFTSYRVEEREDLK